MGPTINADEWVRVGHAVRAMRRARPRLDITRSAGTRQRALLGNCIWSRGGLLIILE
jgi:hypothetical protein